jgi:hypothetical protein
LQALLCRDFARTAAIWCAGTGQQCDLVELKMGFDDLMAGWCWQVSADEIDATVVVAGDTQQQ